ncbi:hypothetical protein [Streptomyces lunaelactis]|nr:hypothetical protein [Streptomyces lunaelactis]
MTSRAILTPKTEPVGVDGATVPVAGSRRATALAMGWPVRASVP